MSKKKTLMAAKEALKEFHMRKISDILGESWNFCPIQLTDHGLLIAIDSSINNFRDRMVSETTFIEFYTNEDIGFFHLWNARGVITPQPIHFTNANNITQSARRVIEEKTISELKHKAIRAVILVVEKGMVCGFKSFSLDPEISNWLSNLIFNSNSSAGIDGQVNVIQKIVSLKAK